MGLDLCLLSTRCRCYKQMQHRIRYLQSLKQFVSVILRYQTHFLPKGARVCEITVQSH